LSEGRFRLTGGTVNDGGLLPGAGAQGALLEKYSQRSRQRDDDPHPVPGKRSGVRQRSRRAQGERLPFRTTRHKLHLLPMQLFLCAIAAVSIALAGSLWWPAAILLAYAVATLAAGTSGHGIDLTAMPRVGSQNVLTQPLCQSARTVFITAHYDRQRGSFLFHPKFVDRLPLFFNVCYASVFISFARRHARFI
jgi:hypothetical protein